MLMVNLNYKLKRREDERRESKDKLTVEERRGKREYLPDR
jgi:hypothetical protein